MESGKRIPVDIILLSSTRCMRRSQRTPLVSSFPHHFTTQTPANRTLIDTTSPNQQPRLPTLTSSPTSVSNPHLFNLITPTRPPHLTYFWYRLSNPHDHPQPSRPTATLSSKLNLVPPSPHPMFSRVNNSHHHHSTASTPPSLER